MKYYVEGTERSAPDVRQAIMDEVQGHLDEANLLNDSHITDAAGNVYVVHLRYTLSVNVITAPEIAKP